MQFGTICTILKTWKTLLQGWFSGFLNCTNDTKSHKASQILTGQWTLSPPTPRSVFRILLKPFEDIPFQMFGRVLKRAIAPTLQKVEEKMSKNSAHLLAMLYKILQSSLRLTTYTDFTVLTEIYPTWNTQCTLLSSTYQQ